MITPPRTTDALPVAIIGAGPVGLAAAAHLAVRGLPFVVFERGRAPAAAMAEWGHVTFFSPWRYVVDDAARRLLEGIGWSMPDPDRDPTGRELIDRYLLPLAAHPAIAPNLRCDARVVSVTRKGMDRVPSKGREERPFEIVVAGSDGREERYLARAVIDASGTWSNPNPAGASGVSRARRAGRGGPHQLRHPRRVRNAAGTLRRPSSDGHRLRPLRDGFDPRLVSPQERRTDDGDSLGHAVDADRADIRRPHRRSAGEPRRARRAGQGRR